MATNKENLQGLELRKKKSVEKHVRTNIRANIKGTPDDPDFWPVEISFTNATGITKQEALYKSRNLKFYTQTKAEYREAGYSVQQLRQGLSFIWRISRKKNFNDGTDDWDDGFF